MERTYKERHLYIYECKGCSRKRACTFRRSKAKLRICRVCRRKGIVDENQLKLFETTAQPVTT